jgi:murein L,D-transpeptidase YcbB/YkuD
MRNVNARSAFSVGDRLPRAITVRRILTVAIAAGLAGISVTARADSAQDDRVLRFEDPFDPAPAESFVSTDKSIRPMISPDSAVSMQSAIAKYEYIVRRGGWQPIPAGSRMSIGSRGDRVIMLRDRLAITGDLREVSGEADKYDVNLEQAVRAFQLRVGLNANGVVDDRTLDELNVPAEIRLRTLQANLPRIIKLSQDLGGKYVVVNIPAAEVEAVEDDHVYSRHVAIVGKDDRQTPEISSSITQLNFNPYWTVPVSIVRKDLLPKLREDPGYLQQMNMRVYQGFNGPEVDPATIDWNADIAEDTYLFRQEPGRINSMGSVKINFPNEHAVYLHDTPTKSLFAQATRLFSSGCVRVDKVHVLTEWLLRGQEEWDRTRIDQVAASGERIDVNLKQPVPLRMVYLTAWAKSDGTISFRPDIYRQDGTDLAQVAVPVAE